VTINRLYRIPYVPFFSTHRGYFMSSCLLLTIQSNYKYLFRLCVVSERIWAEVAVWRSTTSALKDFSWTRTKDVSFGRRLITPWIGLAVCLSRSDGNDHA
jgi:hypothetical protein